MKTIFTMFSLLSLASCIASAAQQPPASQPAPLPAVATQPAAGATSPEIDDLLTRLERSTADLSSFVAKIVYQKEDALLGRTETRSGEIIYRIDGAKKSFAVLFDKLIIPPRSETRLHHYVFDGRWLAEIDPDSKQFIKREIVPPGKTLDPLKLGEGPFPLPVGQSKADVLARFVVSRLDPPQEGLLKGLQNVEGLSLIPRPNTPEARDYQRVEIFYDHATLLPVGINAIESNDNRKTVKLADLQRNPKLDEAMLKKLDITDPPSPPWDISIQPWKSDE